MLERQSTPRTIQSKYSRTISYANLVREIFKRIGNEQEAQKLVALIRCHGVPGNWVVGIYVEGDGAVYTTAATHCRNYDEGFYQLLCWLHWRNFQVFDS